MLDAFFDQALLLLPGIDRNNMSDRIIAQHYGVPTQLLDWSLDAFIALYFAVCDGSSEQSDGALYYIQPTRRITPQNPVQFRFFGGVTRVNPPIVDERVKYQKSVFTIQSFGSNETFMPLDDRELKFSKEGDASHPSDEVHEFGKVIIPHQQKTQILGQLLSMGVDPSVVFPGLQGIGERIAMHARLKNYGGDGLF